MVVFYVKKIQLLVARIVTRESPSTKIGQDLKEKIKFKPMRAAKTSPSETSVPELELSSHQNLQLLLPLRRKKVQQHQN